jgi:soluble lytic murein transglycosylase-like protein
MFRGRIDVADTSISRKSALILAVLTTYCDFALACGSTAAAWAVQSPDIARKYALAHAHCSAGASDAGAPAQIAAPARPDRFAEQLWLYDKAPVAARSGVSAPSVAAPAAPTPETIPVEGLGHRSAGVIRPMQGVSRSSAARALALVPQISQVAERYRIDPLLLHAIAHVESRHNPDAVSHAGALGLMQVMPATARRFGVTQPRTELHDPRISLEVSSAYLKTLQRRFDNDLTLVIAAYNAGEGAVEKYGRRVPPYKETQGYVKAVMAHYRLLLGLRQGTALAAVRPSL